MSLQQEMDFGTSYGRMSPASSQPKTMHSVASLPDLWEQMIPSCRQSDGRVTVWFLDRKDGPRGLSKMPNFSDWPNDASVSSLSQILETEQIPQRFYSSQKACSGILRRAERRGKKLPPQLAHALQAVAGLEQTSI